MYVSIPPRFGVSAAAGAATAATQKTAPRQAAANPDFLIIPSSLWLLLLLLLGWIGSAILYRVFRRSMLGFSVETPQLDASQRTSLQATQWPGRTSRSPGRIRLQLSTAIGQRGWNTQPDGGLIGLGTSPFTGRNLRSASTLGSGTGTASRSARV